jgi:hypothetical protein
LLLPEEEEVVDVLVVDVGESLLVVDGGSCGWGSVSIGELLFLSFCFCLSGDGVVPCGCCETRYFVTFFF